MCKSVLVVGAVAATLMIAACGGGTPKEATESSKMTRKVERAPSAPVNANEWLAASAMLTRANELIRERGWQQGSPVPVARECMATALEHAFQEKDYSIVDFNYAREALARVLNVPRDPQPLPNDVLDIPYWGRELMDWNDAHGRTEADVLNALNAAAQFAVNRRAEALRRSKT
jgi:hypothetical protein